MGESIRTPIERVKPRKPDTFPGSATRNASRFVIACLLLLAIPIAIPWLLWQLISWLCLSVAAWLAWGSPSALFVYSESPAWREYLEGELFPRIHSSLVTLNWSHRRSWNRWALAVQIYYRFAGERAFNPMCVVFRAWRKPITLRYWKAFRDFKHGDPRAVELLNRRLLQLLET